MFDNKTTDNSSYMYTKGSGSSLKANLDYKRLN